MRICDITSIAGVEKIFEKSDIFSGAAIRHQQVQENFLYIPVRHYNYDGFEFLDEALRRGAGGIVLNKEDFSKLKGKHLSASVYVVDSTQSFLQTLAQKIRLSSKFKVAGLTGSVGKTGTLEMMAQKLEGKVRTHRNRGNFNNFFGIVETLFNTPENTDWLMLEIGAQKPGEIGAITRMLQPDVAGVLNCEPVHVLSFGGSLKDVLKAKTEIFSTENKSVWVVNSLYPELISWTQEHRGQAQDIVTFEGKPVANGELDSFYEAAANAFCLAMNLHAGTYSNKSSSETIYKGEQFDYVLDLACTSLVAMEQLLKRVYTFQKKNPGVPVVFVTQGVRDGDEGVPALADLTCKIAALRAQITFSQVFNLTNMNEEELKSEKKNFKGLVVFQDARSAWSKRILNLVNRPELYEKIFPPF